MDIKDRLEWLCDVQPGEVWTEWHWRQALQIRQEVQQLNHCDSICNIVSQAIIAISVFGALFLGFLAIGNPYVS